MRGDRLCALGAGAAGLVLLAYSVAGGTVPTGGDFPNRVVRIVVPYPAGGGVDIAARAVAPCLEERLGTNVIVENVEGGSGAVGSNELLGKPADGHTLAMELTSSAVVTPLSNDVGYQLSDLTPIGEVTSSPYVVLVRPDSAYTTLEELVAAGQNGRLRAAAPGAASQGDLELRLLQQAGLDLSVVPYDGTAGVKTAVLGGDVDFGVAIIDRDILTQQQQGTLSVIGSTGPTREDYLPDVPTLNELPGLRDLGSGTSYIGLVAATHTPDDVLTLLQDDLAQCVAQESVQQAVGPEFVSKQFVDGAALRQAFEEQSAVYAEVAGS